MMVSNNTDLGERMRTASAGQRVTWSMLAGAVVGAVVSLVTVPSAAILVGWDVAVVIYLAWVWIAVWRLDPDTTGRLAKREDPSSPVAELVVIGAGIAMLVAVGFALARAGQATGGMKAFLVTLGLLSVVLSGDDSAHGVRAAVRPGLLLRAERRHRVQRGRTADLHGLRLLRLY